MHDPKSILAEYISRGDDRVANGASGVLDVTQGRIGVVTEGMRIPNAASSARTGSSILGNRATPSAKGCRGCACDDRILAAYYMGCGDVKEEEEALILFGARL